MKGGTGTQASSLIIMAMLMAVVGVLLSPSRSDTAFLFNGFTNNISEISLSGIAGLDPSGMIRLTNFSSRLFGHALYRTPVRLKNPKNPNFTSSFSTTFVFSITPVSASIGGHGFAFFMTPTLDPSSSFPSQYLGLLNASNDGNASNHIFAVEFDTVKDLEFLDINDNHVGINLNNMVSTNATAAAYHQGPSGPSVELNLKGGQNIQAWIRYDGIERRLNVSIANASQPEPALPLLSVYVDLSPVLEDDVYVGFSAATGVISAVHNVLAWSFNGNGSEALPLDLSRLPYIRSNSSNQTSKEAATIAGFTLFGISVLSIVVYASLRWNKRRRRQHREDHMEDWNVDYGPQRFSYRELRVATDGFSKEKLLGVGGFGQVYKGILPSTGVEVAVKRLSQESQQGLREFVAELSSMGRLRHRNLVQLQGWCRRRGELLLVYDYMPNGSLDKMLFSSSSSTTPRSVLGWEARYRIICGVAAALLYLHEEWEQQVVHRDIKANNVLLDADLNGKLSDFGLARLRGHGERPHTTRIVGTLGYLAPEYVRSGKATAGTDIFGFGALLLEVACGRRPLEVRRPEGEEVLVDWVWDLYLKGNILHSADPKLFGVYVEEEMARVLQLGLLCSHPNPEARPTMRQAVQILAGDAPLPLLTPSQPRHSVCLSPIVHTSVLSESSSTQRSSEACDTSSFVTGR